MGKVDLNSFGKKPVSQVRAPEPVVKGPQPDFRGKLDVAAWVKTDKNGQSYLSVCIGGQSGLHFNLFPNTGKEEIKK
jgi:hypothetical protein